MLFQIVCKTNGIVDPSQPLKTWDQGMLLVDMGPVNLKSISFNLLKRFFFSFLVVVECSVKSWSFGIFHIENLGGSCEIIVETNAQSFHFCRV